jgi:hypothetical protein
MRGTAVSVTVRRRIGIPVKVRLLAVARLLRAALADSGTSDATRRYVLRETAWLEGEATCGTGSTRTRRGVH